VGVSTRIFYKQFKKNKIMSEKKIKLNERVEVIGTGTAKNFAKGESYNVHPELATKLIKTGKVSKKK
jgi:hypothetical protein